MGLTDGLPFILFNLHMRYINLVSLLTSPGDPTLRQIIRRHLNGYFVTGQALNEIHSELAGNVCQNGVSVANVNLEHSIRQCIGYDALNLDYVVLSQVITHPGYSLAFSLARNARSLRKSPLSTLSPLSNFAATLVSERRTFCTC